MRTTIILLATLLGFGRLEAQPAGLDASGDSTTARASIGAKRLRLPPPRVTGYMQVHYRFARKTGADSLVDNDDFRVQRLRIGFKGDVSPRVSYEAEIDPRAPDITSVLRDAFVTLRYVPRHDVRVGQQKTQFGYENRESSTDLYQVNRAEMSDAISRGINLRDIGLGLIGNFKLGKGVRLEDAITVVNGSGMNVQADETARKNVWGRVGLRYRNDARDLLARVGVSGGAGDILDIGDPLDPADDVLVKFTRRGVDAQLDHPRFFLAAEYATSKDELKGTGEIDEPVGYYVNFVGKITPRFGPSVRYDVFDDIFKRWTYGAWLGAPVEPVRVLVNYESRQLKDGLKSDDKVYCWLQVRF